MDPQQGAQRRGRAIGGAAVAAAGAAVGAAGAAVGAAVHKAAQEGAQEVAAGGVGTVALLGRGGGELAALAHAGEALDALRILRIDAQVIVGVDGVLHTVEGLVGEVDGHAVGPGHGGLVVGHTTLQSGCQGLGFRGADPFAQVDHVHLVDPALAGELTGVGPGVRYLLIVVALDQVGGGGGEVPKGLRHGARHLGKIHHAQGHLSVGLGPLAGGDEGVHDGLSDALRGNGGVLRQLGEPVGVVPAGARLRFLGGDHVVRIVVADHGGLQRGHEAGVEADPVEDAAALLQGRLDLRQGHGVRGDAEAAALLLVVAVAGEGAAAVIPEDQDVPIRREVLLAVLDEGRQIVRVRHVALAEVAL